MPQAFSQNDHPPWSMWTYQSSWTLRITFFCSGSNNDINVLDRSPLVHNMLHVIGRTFIFLAMVPIIH